MSDSFDGEVAEWQRYVRSSIQARLSRWGKKLARWEIRLRNNPYRLTPDQYESLRQIDFPFAAHDARWLDHYLALGHFHRQHGHSLVRRDGSKIQKLALWANDQRSKRSQGRLPPARQRALNRLGFRWSIREAIWEERFSELKAFMQQHGHMRVPPKGKHEKLSHWIENLRSPGRQFTPKQRRQLDQVGFVWKVHPTRWKAALEELKKFVREHGHADVPQGCSRYPKAAAMLSHQRGEYKSGTIDPVKRCQLDALGVRWSIYDAVWEERYKELCCVHRTLGHVRLPKGWPENIRLERWLRAQREKWHRLASNYRDRLTDLGVRPERVGIRSGYLLKELILNVLKKAGPSGMKVETIAQRVNAKKNIIAVWFFEKGRKTPEIEKIKHGWYRYRE